MDLKAYLPAVSLLKTLEQYVDHVEGATQQAISDAASILKQEWRSQISRAGLGERLPNTIKTKLYVNKGYDPAAVVYTKAPAIMRGFEEGSTILPGRSRFLAVPTSNAPKLIDRKRPTPALWKPEKYGELQFVPARSGKPAMLVAKQVRKSVSKKTGEFRGYRAAKSARAKRTATDVVMFILIPRAKLRDRIDIKEAAAMLTAQIPSMIDKRLD